VNKFKNDWIINQFKGVPISVRSLFQVDIQKIIPFHWSNTHEEYSKENHSGAIDIFKRTGSITKLQKAMGHSSINVSLTYLRGLEVAELKEEDMPGL
jgi:hypothetical protein